MTCPFLNPFCFGKACPNWNEPTEKFGNPNLPRGCKGDNPTAKWAREYINATNAQKESK